MDISSLIGAIIGVVSILIGQALEGGNIGQLLQITAALIVFGGTIGGVVLSFSKEDLIGAIIALKDVFLDKKVDFDETIAEIIRYAVKGRKEGVIALEKDAKYASDPLLMLGLQAVSDGTDPTLVRQMLETQMTLEETQVAARAKVWESAGGYSPTIGIIGAVLGLIQVMQNLSDPSKLGAGIAVAFVATVYGVGAANLFYIPFGSKIKTKFRKELLKKEMITEGILAIQAGESPALIERKLQSFILNSHLKEMGIK
ncbi:TPA: flagellar motor protein [Candidatus Spyradomonas excrementavium]|nr:flagellar motor protein [Candidatus Spyradomonas excrementavium]